MSMLATPEKLIERKPTPLTIKPEGIPCSIRGRDQWIGWKYEWNGTKWTKPPFHASGNFKASTTNATTWSTFEEAYAGYLAGNIDGIGYVFGQDDGLVGIDVDHCIDFLTKDRKFTREEAELILLKFLGIAYIERSVGGDGMHLIVQGQALRCGKGDGDLKFIEVYDATSPRYFTFSGHRLPRGQEEPLPAQDELIWLHKSFFSAKGQSKVSPLVGGVLTSFSADNPAVDPEDVELLVDWAKEADFGAIWRAYGEKPANLDSLFGEEWKEPLQSHSELDMRFFGKLAWYVVLHHRIDDDVVGHVLMAVYRLWPGYRGEEGERKAQYAIPKVLKRAFDERERQRQEGTWQRRQQTTVVRALAQDLVIQSAEDLARVRLMALNSAVHGHPINAFMAKGDGSDAFKDCVEKAYSKAHDVMTVSEVTLGDLPKEVVALKDIQKRFSVLTITKKRPVILDSEKDIITIKDEVKLVLGGKAVLVGFDNAENPIYKDAYPAWEGAKGRRNMTEVVMTSQATSEHQWNLFPGFGVRPKAGCCDRILQHIHEVICSKDDVAYEAMMNLIAWQFQNIGTPSRIIVGLRSSQQQVGKNMFMDNILGRCLKHAYFYSNDANRVFGQFNAQMRGVVVLCLDEAVFAKDRSLAAKIKSAVQAHQLPSEDKFITTVMLPSGLNLWILTNEDHMAHLDPHDARHWLLDVSEHRKGDDSYFASLMKEIENGGVEAFLDLMISRDIKGFLPQRDTPRDTAAGNRAKALSIGDLATQQWLLECVESGYMFGLDDAGGGMLQKPEGDFLNASREWPGDFEIQMKAGALYQSYKKWCAVTKSYGRSPDPIGTFWKILTALGFKQVRSNQARLREVPPLQSLEKDLDDLIAGRISVDP